MLLEGKSVKWKMEVGNRVFSAGLGKKSKKEQILHFCSDHRKPSKINEKKT